MKETATELVETPLGRLLVTSVAEGITSIDWLPEPMPDAATGEVAATKQSMDEEEPHTFASGSINLSAKAWAKEVGKQLHEYFRQERQSFDIPCILHGTEFQLSVWQALSEIPYGETRSYGDIARRIGRAKAVRAVGQANRANPIPIVIPCHRVIGTGGQLVGYAGTQVHLKAALLNLESPTLLHPNA